MKGSLFPCNWFTHRLARSVIDPLKHQITCCLWHWHTVKSRQASQVCHYRSHRFILTLSSVAHSSPGWMDVSITFCSQADKWQRQQLRIAAVTVACGGITSGVFVNFTALRDRIAPKYWQSLYGNICCCHPLSWWILLLRFIVFFFCQ